MDMGLDGNGRSTAVAFWLKSKPGSDFLVTPGSDWEVELHRSQDVVVARCKGVVNETDALPAAREAIEQAIDQICFRFNDPLEIKSPDEDYLILRSDGGTGELTYHTVAPFSVRIGPIDLSVVDAGGAVRLQSTTPMRWMPVLRYYRLSQTRDDVFDAYRYIFLAFEALLEWLYPKKKVERGSAHGCSALCARSAKRLILPGSFTARRLIQPAHSSTANTSMCVCVYFMRRSLAERSRTKASLKKT